MKKLFIKSLIVSSLVSLLTLSAKASFTFTFVVNANTSTNIFPNFNNPIKVSQVSITSGASSQGIVTIYDTATNYATAWQAGMALWSYTNAPYTNITYYVTNYYTFYTNYYGVASYSYTNKAQIDITNSVAVATNFFNAPLNLSAGTNTTVNFTGLAAPYNNGMWATNSGTGPATLTVTYQ